MSTTSGSGTRKIKNMSSEKEGSSLTQGDGKPASPVSAKDFSAMLVAKVTSSLISHNFKRKPSSGKYFVLENYKPKKRARRVQRKRTTSDNNKKKDVKDAKEKVFDAREVEESASTVASNSRAALRRRIQRPKWLVDTDGAAYYELASRKKKRNGTRSSTSQSSTTGVEAKGPTPLTEPKEDPRENQEIDQGKVSPPPVPPSVERKSEEDVAAQKVAPTKPQEDQKIVKKEANEKLKSKKMIIKTKAMKAAIKMKAMKKAIKMKAMKKAIKMKAMKKAIKMKAMKKAIKMKALKKVIEIKAMKKLNKIKAMKKIAPNVSPAAIEDAPLPINEPANVNEPPSPTLELTSQILGLNLNEVNDNGAQAPPPIAVATPEKNRKRSTSEGPSSSKGSGERKKPKGRNDSTSMVVPNDVVEKSGTASNSMSAQPDLTPFIFKSKGDMGNLLEIDGPIRPIASSSFFTKKGTANGTATATVEQFTIETSSLAEEITAMKPKTLDRQLEDMNGGKALNLTMDKEIHVFEPEASSSAAVSRSDSFAEAVDNINKVGSECSIPSAVPQQEHYLSAIFDEATSATNWPHFNSGGLPMVVEKEDRSNSLSMNSLISKSQSEKIKSLDDSSEDDDDDDNGDSVIDDSSDLDEESSEKTEGQKIKEECLRFLTTKVSEDDMWRIRKELKDLKTAKDYFKFGKLSPLAAGLMHDIFCQSLDE